MYLCHCMAVTAQTVRAAIASGARNIADITQSCRAGRGCTGCHHMLQAFLDASLGSDGSTRTAVTGEPSAVASSATDAEMRRPIQ